jgi:hypothetical protein
MAVSNTTQPGRAEAKEIRMRYVPKAGEQCIVFTTSGPLIAFVASVSHDTIIPEVTYSYERNRRERLTAFATGGRFFPLTPIGFAAAKQRIQADLDLLTSYSARLAQGHEVSISVEE